MPDEDNKALIRRFYKEIDEGNLDAKDGVHSRGAGNWSQLMAGSGGNHGLP